MLAIDLGGADVSLGLRHWVNSGLMTFFFFVLGLEARREFDLGELRERRRFALPLLAGIGGMAVAIYLAFNMGSSSGLHDIRWHDLRHFDRANIHAGLIHEVLTSMRRTGPKGSSAAHISSSKQTKLSDAPRCAACPSLIQVWRSRWRTGLRLGTKRGTSSQ